jgi:hypothetical protein
MTEKSQSGGFEDPRDPESPILRPTWRRRKQSVTSDPPPVKGKIEAMTQELRHLKGLRLTSGEEAALRKAATACQGPSLRAKWKRKLRKSGA